MSAHGKSGFALPSVIVVIAIMTLALWSAAVVLEGINRDLRQLRASERIEIAGLRAEARLQFLIATEPLGPRGLRVHGARIPRDGGIGAPLVESAAPARVREPEADFWFDGRPYVLEFDTGAVTVQVQDLAGLYNVNVADAVMIRRFLRQFGADERQANALADALFDFVDYDDLRRLNGAEVEQYRRAQRPAPANTWLRQPEQLAAVWGWREALGRAGLARLIANVSTVPPSAPFNVNTATPAALRAWFGLDEAGAAKVIEARQEVVLRGLHDVVALTGASPPTEDFRLYSFPYNGFQLIVSTTDSDPSPAQYKTTLYFAGDVADRPFFLGPQVVNADGGEEGEVGGRGDLDPVPGAAGVSNPRARRARRS